MNIIELILAIAVCGFLVWLVTQIPMPALFRNIIVGLTCFAVVIYLLQAFGLIGGHILRLK